MDGTGVDPMQGFAELRIPDGTYVTTLQAGRQLLAYGLERLIGLRRGPNVLQALDGGLGWIESGPWRATRSTCDLSKTASTVSMETGPSETVRFIGAEIRFRF